MLERWILRHWFALCVGCVIFGIAIKIAYIERGYMGIGSEWLIIPLAFATEGMIKNHARRVRRCKYKKRNCRR